MNQNPIGSVRSPEAEDETEIAESGSDEKREEINKKREESEGGDSNSRAVTFPRGATVFIVLFAVLQWMPSRSGE